MKTIILLLAFAVTGCASIRSAFSSPEKRAAISKALWGDAVSILGSVAVNSLVNIVQTEINGGNVDFTHAAAEAAWSATSTVNLAKLVNDATGGTVPLLADKVAAIASQAVQNGISVSTAVNAVASAISSVSLAR